MAGAIMVILAMLFVAPFVLGAYAVVQTYSERNQMRYFGFCTAMFAVMLIVGAVVLVINPV